VNDNERARDAATMALPEMIKPPYNGVFRGCLIGTPFSLLLWGMVLVAIMLLLRHCRAI